ncbi:pyocin knob domain-containing protein [Citrobacter freundii]|uniref:pyocin knob domain-containing protein n=1 Tax=Citrobacter freundii TaxID=546 RepID=UPI0034D51329
MAINNFKPFATAANANVTSQADWESLPALLSGFMAGKASSAQVNKAIRQASFIAAALAQYTANKSGQDVLDNGDLNGFITKMSAAFGKDFQALDATLTALAGLETGANKLPYFTGTDTAAQTDLTSVGRDIIGKNTIADILTYLGLAKAFLIKEQYLPASVNLNTLGGDDAFGIYGQELAASATAAKNYPEQDAGTLLVLPATYNGLQIYLTIGGHIWIRISLDKTNTRWSPWYSQLTQTDLNNGLATKVNISAVGTAASKNVGTGSGQIPDMSAWKSSGIDRGWRQGPDGFIEQWGVDVAAVGGTSGGGATVNLPIAFANKMVSVLAIFDNGSPIIPAAGASPINSSSFKLRCSESTGTFTFRWVAIGY